MSPYSILGVSPNASDEAIAKAHKRLAKKYHPDLNPGNEKAARKMGDINRAYDEIKAMRQGKWAQQTASSHSESDVKDYTYYYKKPKIHPMAMILAVLVTILFVRLILSILYGGFGGGYYINPAYHDPADYYSYTVPGYSYDPIP